MRVVRGVGASGGGVADRGSDDGSSPWWGVDLLFDAGDAVSVIGVQGGFADVHLFGGCAVYEAGDGNEFER